MKHMNLTQPPYDTSLIGVVKGALDYLGIDTSRPETFALSGHAFAINIHEELCPSGPYCWDQDRLRDLFPNLGIQMIELGMVMPTASATERDQLAERVRTELDGGNVCSVLHMDHQLVTGYDDTGFDLALPWGEGVVDSTPARLTFATWKEFAHGPPANFFRFDPTPRRPESSATGSVLDFAVDVWRRPEQFAESPYGTGNLAYENWLAGISAGHGGSHGNWWNAVVWGECRERAGDYFLDLAAAEFPGAIDQREARELAVDYRECSRLLYRASDKTASVADKRRFVEQARDLDAGCVERIAELRTR